LPPEFATETVGVPATAIELAGMLAVTWDALTKAVFIAIPPKLTTKLDMKLLPDTLKVNPGLPAVALAGESPLAIGCPITPATANGKMFEDPPGDGLTTVTFSVPASVISLAGRVAWRSVAFTNIVEMGCPFTSTLAEGLKLLPATCKGSAALPGRAVEGVSCVRSGVGLFTVNVTAADRAPPGFVTTTIGVPATAIALAGILASKAVGLEKIVGIAGPPKLTLEFAVKLLPETINWNAGPPAVALAGLRVPTTGWTLALVIVRVRGLDVPPPPDPPRGFVTVTLAVPAVAMSADESVMLRSVADANAVVRAAPLKFTTDVFTKLNPNTKSVEEGPPAVTLAGFREERAGAATEAGAGGT